MRFRHHLSQDLSSIELIGGRALAAGEQGTTAGEQARGPVTHVSGSRLPEASRLSHSQWCRIVRT